MKTFVTSALFPVSGICLAAGLLPVPPARARIGETVEECIVRYGDPVAETTGRLQGVKSVSFAKAGVRVRIEFVDDKAAFLSFARHGMDASEEQKLLDSNAGGLKWNGVAEYIGRRCWMAPGKGGEEPRYASAFIFGVTTTLEVATKTWTDAIHVQKLAMAASLPKPQPRPAAPPDEPVTPPPPPPAPVKKVPVLDGF